MHPLGGWDENKNSEMLYVLVSYEILIFFYEVARFIGHRKDSFNSRVLIEYGYDCREANNRAYRKCFVTKLVIGRL